MTTIPRRSCRALGPALLALGLGAAPLPAATNIPGIVQIEDYDLGGEGAAYHDQDATNHAGLYRPLDGVDIESNGAGGYSLGWIQDGEWLRYTLNATNSFTNQVRYKVASGWTNPFCLRLSMDGETVDVFIPGATNGWTAWTNQWSSRPFYIASGIHTMRVHIIIGGFNFDEMQFAASTNPVPPYKDPLLAVTNRVADLFARMTLDEKLGQMCQPDKMQLTKSGSVEADVRDYLVGSVLNGGDSDPYTNSPEAWADMTDFIKAYALQTRLGIPLIYGVDGVHGHNNVCGATVFPHNIGLGAMRDERLVERAAQVAAEEIAATGIDWTFAPCVAVPRSEWWGRFYEGFGETPELAASNGAAAIRGYQGSDLASPTSILACAKHFAGDGGTSWGTGVDGGIDQGNVILDEATFRAIHVKPYEAALAAGVLSVMPSYSRFNGLKMHAHTNWLTDVLKGELGFSGFIVSDWAAIDQISPGNYTNCVVASVNAGVDMVMVPGQYETFLRILKLAVTNGWVSTNRIDDAVRRILDVKFRLGLFEEPFGRRSLLSRVGCPEHRAVARQAVRESLVILKNEHDVLPIRKDFARVHVAGKNATNLGYQCGGWTITWQGGSGPMTTGTTVWAAIANTVGPTTTVTYSEDGSGAAGADVGVVVVGETPYAEWLGDRQDLSLIPEDRAAIENVRTQGVPVVVVLESGRPMFIDPEWTNWDAAVAAWLPGTEGQGVADVLFGDYFPQSRLPHSWPRTDQVPVNVGDASYDPLLEYGCGERLEPALAADFGAGELELSWVRSTTGFSLYSSTSLVGMVTWAAVPGAPADTNGLYRVTIDPTHGANQFYRLIRP